MRHYFLLLVACLGCSLSAAMTQSRPSPACFLRHPTNQPRRSPGLLPGGAVVAPASQVEGPIPTVWAAVAYAPLPGLGSPLVAAEASAPRRDLTGVWAYPPYDPYWNLPETFRKNTLPAVWAEPLPLQLLRSALGRPGFPAIQGLHSQA